MADLAKPTVLSTKTNFPTEIVNAITAVAKMDYSSDTNIPTNTIRYFNSTRAFERYNGSTWDNVSLFVDWVEVTDTWTYASATTITVPTDATTRYAVGDRLRLKQGGSYKYFYIIAVGATTITITGGADYTLVNAAISDVAFSKQVNPVGFPAVFNWTPVQTGFSSDPINAIYRFSLVGKVCKVFVGQGGAGTSNATTFTISSPITAKTLSNGVWSNFGTGINNGAALTTPALIYILSAGTAFQLFRDASGAAWTAANGKLASFQLEFEI